MSDQQDLKAYDQMYEKMQLLRVLVRGAVATYEDQESDIFSLLKKQENRNPYRAYGDLGTAIYMMRDIIVGDSEESSQNLTSL